VNTLVKRQLTCFFEKRNARCYAYLIDKLNDPESKANFALCPRCKAFVLDKESNLRECIHLGDGAVDKC